MKYLFPIRADLSYKDIIKDSNPEDKGELNETFVIKNIEIAKNKAVKPHKVKETDKNGPLRLENFEKLKT